MDQSAHHSALGRIIVVVASLLLLVSCWWTLQAFVPEPYFLRTPHQLKTMSTPDGFGHVERSLLPFYAVGLIELVALAILAVFAWFSRTGKLALFYLLAVLSMAAATFVRLSEALKGFN